MLASTLRQQGPAAPDPRNLILDSIVDSIVDASLDFVVRASVSQKVAMKLTGHLTPSVFDRYNITDDRDRRDAVAKLAAAAQDKQILQLKRKVARS